jgi:hypothetical protein
MPIAPYSMDTISRIVNAAGAGKGPAAIGEILGWPPDRVRRVAEKHHIKLPDDPPPEHKPALKPAEETPLRRKRGRYGKMLKAHPRYENISIAISTAARERLGELSCARGKALSGAVSIAVDYALRHGLFAATVDAAIAELEGADNAV